MGLFNRKKNNKNSAGLDKSAEHKSIFSTSEVMDGLDPIPSETEMNMIMQENAGVDNDQDDLKVNNKSAPTLKVAKKTFKSIDTDYANEISEAVMPVKKSKKKFSKKLKKENSEEEEKELQSRLSNSVQIEHLPGIAKEDAIQTALHWANDHASNPSNCYYNVLPVENGAQSGYMIEVQEGVGRSYLPSVMKLAQDNPNRIVVIPMFRRNMTVFYSPKTGEFDAQILPEGADAPIFNGEEPLKAIRTSVMTPVMKQHMHWLLSGVITSFIGGLSLISALTFYVLDPETKIPPEWNTSDVAQLPVMQWPRLQSSPDNSYVVRLEYSDNNWRIVTQDVSAQVDIIPASESVDPNAPVDGGDGSGLPTDPNALPPIDPPAGPQGAGGPVGPGANNVPPQVQTPINPPAGGPALP